MIRSVARSFRTTEPEDLEAELARKLVVLKTKPRAHIRNWQAYVWQFLRNKASNWIRDRRAEEGGLVPLAEALDEPQYRSGPKIPAPILKAPDAGIDDQIAFASAWRELDPRLQQLWLALLEARGNQAGAARRLGIHRNTVRLWISKINRILRRHGLQRE